MLVKRNKQGVIGFEATKLGKKLKKMWAPLQHLWMFFWILLSWVLFRAPGLNFAFKFYKALFGLQGKVTPLPYSQTIPFPIAENSVILAFGLGVILAVPVIPWIRTRLCLEKSVSLWITILQDVGLGLLLVYCLGLIAATGPMPGIYGQF